MALQKFLCISSVAALIALSAIQVRASDPELVTDFFVPEGVNASSLDGNFFTFTGLRGFSAPNGKFAVNKVFVTQFPALTGLGVSVALLSFQGGSMNPPHIHPRGTEVLYVLQGSLQVGLIDSTNKLYNQTLSMGDLFVFPKGLVHFQVNTDWNTEAKALSAFSGSNPGVVSLPATLFGSGISDGVLEQAFAVSAQVIDSLKAPFLTAN